MNPIVIVRRDDVVKRIAEREKHSLTAALRAVNEKLNQCDSLPLNIVAPENTAIRSEVQRLLREAGWRVEVKTDKTNTYFEVQ